MSDAFHIRLADPDRDAAAAAGIYRPAVEASVATFEEVAPSAHEMRRRMRTTLARTPWLVAVADGTVVGYAYAGPHRERAGYRWSVDVSAYVASAWQGRRVGRSLYDVLLSTLARQGFVNVYAGIALPNPASVALHESIGMRRIGVYRRVGYKFGAWHDVAWFGMTISQASEPPAEPIPLPQLLPRHDSESGTNQSWLSRSQVVSGSRPRTRQTGLRGRDERIGLGWQPA